MKGPFAVERRTPFWRLLGALLLLASTATLSPWFWLQLPPLFLTPAVWAARAGNAIRRSFRDPAVLEARVQELEREVAWLRSLLKQNAPLPEAAPNLIPAHVVLRLPGYPPQRVLVNRGRRDGVREGAGVLAGPFALGIVVKVYDRYALVRTIWAPGFRAGARVGEAVGFFRTTREAAELTYVEPAAPIQNLQLVRTSGDDGIFPPDYLLGVIEERLPDGGLPYQSFRVRRTANPGALRGVLIYVPPYPSLPD